MELANLKWPEVDALPRDTTVLIPVAALEQHGHHLPMFTDSMLLAEIVNRAYQKVSEQVLLTPLMWLGNSHHHMDFPGTVSADPKLWIELLGGIVDNFIKHGFRKIVVINGHGGNDVPGRQALFELRQRYRDRMDLLLLFATYWNLADAAQSIPESQQSDMGHACEWETSMILAIAPDQVGDYASAADVRTEETFGAAHRAWTIPDISKVGHIGSPSVATAEKGEKLLELFSESAAELLQRVVSWKHGTLEV